MSKFIPVFDDTPVYRGRAALPPGSAAVEDEIAAIVAADRGGVTCPAEDRKLIGEHIGRFERLAAALTGLERVAVTGTDPATTLGDALRALGVGAGDRVAIFGAAHAATAAAVVARNAIPRPIDAEPGTWSMSQTKLADVFEAGDAARRPVAAAVLAPRYDRLGEFVELGRLCRAYGVRVVGDLTHAFWAQAEGHPLAVLCDVAVLAVPGPGPYDSGEVGMLAGDEALVARALTRPGPDHGLVQRRGLSLAAELLVAGYRLEQLAEMRETRADGFAAIDAAAEDLPGLAPTPPDSRRSVGPQHGKLLGLRLADHGFRPVDDAGLRADLVTAIRHAYAHLLGHEVVPPAAPLNDPGSGFAPLADPATLNDADYRAAIDPRSWRLPNLGAAYRDALVIEADFGLLPDAGELLAIAHERISTEARRLQERVPEILARFGAEPAA